jgi:hypothetical protein
MAMNRLPTHMRLHLAEAERWGHSMQVQADHIAIEQLAAPAPLPMDMLMVPKFEIQTTADDQVDYHINNLK